MSKNVIIISSSPRKGGNSEALCEQFAKGVVESGNKVETVYLRELSINYCHGCLACTKLGRCVQKDDANELNVKLHDADVIAFATPIYYYSISGQLKTMLDRANPLYDSDYKFTDIYLLAAAAEDEDYTVEGTKTAVQGWIDCFERAKLCGTVFAGGVNAVGDIAEHKALEEAYSFGKNI